MHQKSEAVPDSSPSVVYLWELPAAEIQSGIERGAEPRERLYNLPELQERGWRVTSHEPPSQSSVRHRVKKALSPFIQLMGVRTFRAILSSDIVVVKGSLSLLRTLTAKLLGKRVVYLDSMFAFPNRFWRRWSARWNLTWADRTVGYSESQADLWSRELNVDRSKITVIPFGMDLEFYGPVQRSPKDYVLAIGRDMGRDYATLVRALEGTGLRLRLVTLPYLLPQEALEAPWVEVTERVSYDELFELYSGALASIIPLKSGVSYPSGIRALYEASLLGVPSIVTHTPVLEEDFEHGANIWYVSPEDPDDLRSALVELRDHPEIFEAIAEAAKKTVRERFSTERSADGLERVLRELAQDLR